MGGKPHSSSVARELLGASTVESSASTSKTCCTCISSQHLSVAKSTGRISWTPDSIAHSCLCKMQKLTMRGKASPA